MVTDFTGIVNLGSGENLSLKLISEIIEDLSGKKIISKNQQLVYKYHLIQI